MRFVHLHLHSEYSLLDGGNRIDRLIARVKELDMDTVALTDHGNLHGAVAFYSQARAEGIKPILGIEAYVAPDVDNQRSDRTNRKYSGVVDGGFHLVLLAQNQVGWQNLLQLSSDAFIEGFYFKPRMDKTTLEQYGEGLIAINGHLGSSVAYWLNKFEQSGDPAHYRRAADEARWHQQTFGPDQEGQPRFYLELQRHGQDLQEKINHHVMRLARELEIPLVADNDVHYLLEQDHDAHDTLCCISTGKTKQEANRLRYSTELYLKSPQQMTELFTDVPEAIENTVRIAERCNVELDFTANHAPVVKIEKRQSPDAAQVTRDAGVPEIGSARWYQSFCSQYELHPFDSHKDNDSPQQLKKQCDHALRELAEAGLLWRYGSDHVTCKHRARLERELEILAGKNISAYFLIVWDFVNEARRRSIPVSARGSGVGTMVGYCLGLSNACPVRYGLLFERFTDPDRSEYPDIDIDICQDGRQEIIDYVREKYGHVAQIITFGTLKARAAIRDVGRVHNVPLPTVDRICKLIGDGHGITIDQALKQEPELKSLYEQDEQIRTTVDTARRLEGLSRHAGVHAAGVVIATEPLAHIVPLAVNRQQKKEVVVTQWDGPGVGKVGLLKMDFLGLRTHSIIDKTVALVRESLDEQTIRATVGGSGGGDSLDLDRLNFDDPAVFDLFQRGETVGVFQFESGGMRNTLMGMKPDRIEDLIAANALFRPGPMELINEYNDRKHGRRPVPRNHPIVEKFTDESYGIMVYQEQVMQIVHELGGIPLRAAYTLIKAISKKQQKVINANRDQFIQGAVDKGLGQSQAADLFELVLKFAGYGFNKSHSTGYAILAYQTAYLKTYFPVQYMAALLTYESVSIDKVVEYIDECRRVRFRDGHCGISVRPPDIMISQVGFTVAFEPDELRQADHGHIRFGLGAVRGVGEKAIQAIMAARREGGRFESLYDFCDRVPPGVVNRATIEALIKCGAFDSIHGEDRRAAMVEALDGAIQVGQRAASDRASGQMNFFGSFDETAQAEAAVADLPKVPSWSTDEQLRHEKSVLGFYLSSHPLDGYRPILERYATSIADARELPEGALVVIGGVLGEIKPTVIRKGRNAGQKMARIKIEDGVASMEGLVFSEPYVAAGLLLAKENIVLLKGKIDRYRQQPSLIVSEVLPVEDAVGRLTRAVRIVIGRPAVTMDDLAKKLAGLKQLLATTAIANGGGAEVVLEIHDGGNVVLLRLCGLRIRVDATLPDQVATLLGWPDCCRLIGPPRHSSGGPENGASAGPRQGAVTEQVALVG